jgi:hypothetical protein
MIPFCYRRVGMLSIKNSAKLSYTNGREHIPHPSYPGIFVNSSFPLLNCIPPVIWG